MLDRVEVQLSERFDQESLKILQKVESALLTGHIDDALAQHPELNRASLSEQLPLFRSKYPYSSSEEAVKLLRGLPVEVRGLFNQVLTRILLVAPVSSCEAERSFSALHRLKTWLRSTMAQERLNIIVVCNVHKERLDKLDMKMIRQEFVGSSDAKKITFVFLSRNVVLAVRWTDRHCT